MAVPTKLNVSLPDGKNVSMLLKKDNDSFEMQYINEKPAFHSLDKRLSHIWVPYARPVF